MKFSDLAEQASQSAVGWAVAGILAGILWLVRRVITNQKQIDLMKNDQKSRDKERERDRDEYRAVLAEIKSSQNEMARDIKSLFQRSEK